MTVEEHIDGGVAVLTMARPDVLNAFNDELGSALLEVVGRAAGDGSVRSIVLTGSGRAFSAGEDLAALAGDYDEGRSPELDRILESRYNPLIRALRAAPKPVLAALNGVAAGAGASVALACDLRIAAAGSRLVFPFVNVGLVPDSGAAWFLTRMIGPAKACELLMLGRPVPAQDALRLGLVHEVVEETDDFEARWRELATSLARGPTHAYASTKRLLNESWDLSLDDQLDLEVELQGLAGRTADHLEGVQAFLAKRKPQFRGS